MSEVKDTTRALNIIRDALATLNAVTDDLNVAEGLLRRLDARKDTREKSGEDTPAPRPEASTPAPEVG